MFIEQFKVITISSNTNSFGLYSVVLASKSGIAFQVYANSLNTPKENELIDIPFAIRKDETIDYNFAQRGYEVPTRLQDVPKEVLIELFPDNVQDFTTYSARGKQVWIYFKNKS